MNQIADLPAQSLTFTVPGDVEHALPVSEDYEQVNAWLNTYAMSSPETQRAYLKEAKRFMRWLEYTGKNIKDLKKEDATAYLHFLASPPSDWIALPHSNVSDLNGYFRLLKSDGLSAESINYTNRVLRQLFDWLRDDTYVSRNVFRLSHKAAAPQLTTQERYLDLDAWHWLWHEIINLENSAISASDCRKSIRIRWIFALLYHTGLRCSEAANAQMNDFIFKRNYLQLKVKGKGKKLRMIAINSELRKELIRYRRANPSIFTGDLPSTAESVPVIRSLRQKMTYKRLQVVDLNPGITSRQLCSLIRTTVDSLVKKCKDESIRIQIEKMTVHWMRHTNGTHRVMAGSSLLTVQDELGHSDPKTTRIYAKTIDDQRQTDAEKLAILSQRHLK